MTKAHLLGYSVAMNKKAAAFTVVSVIVVLAAAYGLFSVSRGDNPASSIAPSPSEGISPTPTSTPISHSTTPSPTASSFWGPTGLRHPATCSVGGNITFLKPDLSANDDAHISWQYVDLKARHINWSVTPNDKLAVGPNLFEILSLPSGTSLVTVGLPSQPKAKSYILRASVTYGEVVDNNVVVRTTACSGEIRVMLAF